MCNLLQMTRNILSEIAMLSTLACHQRIVAYLGASYRPHPIFREDHLFVVTEFMEGVSIKNFRWAWVLSLYIPPQSLGHSQRFKVECSLLKAGRGLRTLLIILKTLLQ